jgi:hypothetical protein
MLPPLTILTASFARSIVSTNVNSRSAETGRKPVGTMTTKVRFPYFTPATHTLIDGAWADSAYVFVGGLPFELTEGDVITIMSQYVPSPFPSHLRASLTLGHRFGEVADINMPRDKETGKTKGFAFIMYEDQRSTVLAVDNLTGAEVLGRTLRVSLSFCGVGHG